MHSKFPVKFHHRVSPPFLINPNHHHQFFCKIVCCAKNSSPQEDKFKFKLQGQSSGDNKWKFNDNGKDKELNLKPQLVDKKLFDGEGGAYYIWSSSTSPLLSEAKLGTGKFVLKPRGMALPHYADSAKIGYVVHGICTVGLVSPNSPKETILIIKKGDVIPVPLGAISWWFNHGDSELVIVYLGETRKAHVPGQFTYFYIAGTTSILGAFSTEFIARAFNLTETDSQKLPKSQTGTLIIKLAEGITIPPTSLDTKEKYIVESDKELVGKDLITITESNFGGLGKVGLSARVVKLGAKGMFGPIYTTDSSVQMIYVIKGSGKVQIVANGKRVLDAEVKEGELVIVPKFYAFAQIAGEEGMECFSVVTSPEPEFELLAGKESVWNSFSPLVMQTTLGITPEFEELFKSKNENSTVVAPPKKN